MKKTTPRRDSRRRPPVSRGLPLCASIVAVTAFAGAFTDPAITYAQDKPFNFPLVWGHEPAASIAPRARATPPPALPAAPAIPASAPEPVLPTTPSSGSLPASPFSPPSSALAGKTSYDSLIETIAAEFDIDAGLLHAVVQTESGYDASAVSPKGAIGLMQVLPTTGRRFGFTDLKDPKVNLSAGAAYLKWLLDRFDDDLELALAAYNAGESAVERYGSTVPPYRETRSYVASVISRYRASSSVRASHERTTPVLATGTSATQYAPSGPPTSLPPLRLLGKLGSLLLSAPPSQSNASRNAHAD